MTDRELLEKAAKAAGMEASGYDGVIYAGFGSREWNPLTDDGDALRLAVTLRIDPMFDLRMHDGTPCVSVVFPINGAFDVISEPTGTEFYAATRRAIVRAAAAIGAAK